MRDRESALIFQTFSFKTLHVIDPAATMFTFWLWEKDPASFHKKSNTFVLSMRGSKNLERFDYRNVLNYIKRGLKSSSQHHCTLCDLRNLKRPHSWLWINYSKMILYIYIKTWDKDMRIQKKQREKLCSPGPAGLFQVKF